MKGKRYFIIILAVILGIASPSVQATLSTDALGITFGTANDVGASLDTVYSVALGDLDNDGDLDVVSGSGPNENYELIVWQNDGTPFSGLWPFNDVGATSPDSNAMMCVALDDLDHDGDLDIVSGTSRGEVIVWQNDGTPFSGTWPSNQVGSASWSTRVALGDLDGDGNLDIVSGETGGFVIAWRNDGTPFSGAWVSNDVGASTATVYSIAVGDLNNDGRLDIVSGSAPGEDYEVIVWQNDNSPFSGLWPSNNVWATSSEVVRSLALGDLDSDGDLDIVFGTNWQEDHQVSVLQNDGTPFSGLWVQNGALLSETIYSVALGDLDNDGDLDIVSGSDSTAGTEVSSLQNDDTPFSGLWALNEVGHSDSSIRSVAIGDLDNDGDLDVVSGSHEAEDYEIIAHENTLPERPWPLAFPSNNVGAGLAGVYSVALGDLDNDGDLDAVSGSGSSAAYEIIAWQSDGTPFDGPWTSHNVGSSDDYVWAVVVGDLDDDGDLDIVSSGGTREDYEIIAWRNDGTPGSMLWIPNDLGTGGDDVWSLALGDLDNDGDLDVISGRGADTQYQVVVWENEGTPLSGPWTYNDVGASNDDVWSVAVGDLDNDGDLDIVTGSGLSESHEVIAWQNDGTPFSGDWPRSNVGASSDSVWAVALGDVDNDGDLDIVSGSAPGEDYEVIVWQNDGTPFGGLWAQNDVGTIATGVWSLALGDMDNDGDLDAVSGDVSESGPYHIIVWKNNGTPFDGLWEKKDMGTADARTYSVALGDLDTDGDLDVVSSGGYLGADAEVIAWQNGGEIGKVCLPLVLRY
jgi:hypothetical protein